MPTGHDQQVGRAGNKKAGPLLNAHTVVCLNPSTKPNVVEHLALVHSKALHAGRALRNSHSGHSLPAKPTGPKLE